MHWKKADKYEFRIKRKAIVTMVIRDVLMKSLNRDELRNFKRATKNIQCERWPLHVDVKIKYATCDRDNCYEHSIAQCIPQSTSFRRA